MNRLTIGLLLSLPLFSISLEANKEAHHHTKHVNLGDRNDEIKKILASLDGIMINGDRFATMLKVRNKLRAILTGDVEKQAEDCIVIYTFKGQKYSISDLAALESNYVGDPELVALLAEAKNNFERMVTQFIDQAKGVKELLEKLIEESCYRRNRANSILLTWAGCRDGHETVIFHTEVQSFKALTEFCHDLENYLMDLMYSCPKAMDQYKKKREIYTAEHNK